MLNFFEQFPELTAIMSEKEDGSLRIASDEAIRRKNQKNRELFFEKFGIDGGAVVSANLVHGNHVEVVTDAETKIITKTDALITTEKGAFLAITIADCVPVFFYEKEKGIVALAHAGWRGIVGDVLKNTVDGISSLGGNKNDLFVALGPGINECHFEIKADALESFADYHEFITKRDGKMFVDLKSIIKKQLTGLGIKETNIENNETCTFEADNLFSFRRDKTPFVDAMIAIIGLK
ncbi:MAG: hypothetical protein US57_C0011G0079 [Candidatus Moranbacteria bacterium GW2011_GWC2_37_73]|nr:MAG: hypothetical protein UR95_C0006G0101 [Parcubacteria group bacterium GW2011_GWC1_36_108]KKQ00493.1 MAG: hypothetical protein US09_C0011G0051 [Candidatus Moranbacteria bacterium GW2011_GWD1_36_198]KKQ01725.1 MAG: hypothetical protein US10_C0009G0044 [Candidatus Moranbacteria bacterium GW2011_GWD2_36_198]KKQ39591.1 MAG: hypothetical protein US57_C0011G0079 [Candidatus Moranbacteria bacterium GW2011_GWC2_37_73]HAR99978.1 peptidoglycan editing factor PgeF [Candidatus Moranbacteria bacterium]